MADEDSFGAWSKEPLSVIATVSERGSSCGGGGSSSTPQQLSGDGTSGGRISRSGSERAREREREREREQEIWAAQDESVSMSAQSCLWSDQCRACSYQHSRRCLGQSARWHSPPQ